MRWVRVDCDGHLLVLNGRRLSLGDRSSTLTTKETALLVYLADNIGAVAHRHTLLQVVWGYQQGAATRTLDTTVRRLRAKIEPNPSEPTFIETIRGEGYRLKGKVMAPGVAALGSNPGRAREPDSTFVGRFNELQALKELVDGGCRLVSIVGPEGIGKSRLVTQLLAQPVGAHVHHCYLGPESVTLGTLQAALLEVIPYPGARDVGHALRRMGRAIVVLYNLHGPSPSMIEALEGWLTVAPEIQWLITSSSTMGLTKERAFSLGPLLEKDAVELLSSRLDLAPSEIHLRYNELARICRALDNLPLALELVAPSLLANEGDEAGKFEAVDPPLLSGLRQADEALQIHIRRSLDRLSPDALSLLIQSLAFVDGFTYKMACTVFELESSNIEVSSLLYGLVDQSLLNVQVSRSNCLPPRLTLLNTVRRHLMARFEDDKALATARRRLGTYYRRDTAYLHFASTEKWDGSLSHLAQEKNNIVALIEGGWLETDETIQLLSRLWHHFNTQGALREFSDLVHRALGPKSALTAHLDAKDALAQAYYLLMARVALSLGDPSACAHHLDLAGQCSGGPPEAQIEGHFIRGSLFSSQSDHAASTDEWERALGLSVEQDNPCLQARALSRLGNSALLQRDYLLSRDYYYQSIGLYRSLALNIQGDMVEANVAKTCALEGAYAEAEALLRRLTLSFEKAGWMRNALICVGDRIYALSRLGDFKQSLNIASQWLPEANEGGLLKLKINLHLHIAALGHILGDIEGSDIQYDLGLSLAKRHGGRREAGVLTYFHSLLRLEQGDVHASQALLDSALRDLTDLPATHKHELQQLHSFAKAAIYSMDPGTLPDKHRALLRASRDGWGGSSVNFFAFCAVHHLALRSSEDLARLLQAQPEDPPWC